MARRSGGVLPESVSVESEVSSDFDVRQSPLGRSLGNTFPSSGRLGLELLQDDQITAIQRLSERNMVNVLKLNQDCNSLVDALNELSHVDKTYFNHNGSDGLLISLDGVLGFLSFRPKMPNIVPKPKQHLFSSKIRKYTFKTSIHVDETCRYFLGTDRDVIDCVNFCLVERKLGNTYRCHRSGKLELVEGIRPSRRGQKLRKVASNVVDSAMTLLSFAGEATSVFPPASAAIKSVLAVRTLKKTCEDHRAEAQNGLERVNNLSQNAQGIIQDAHGKRRGDIEHGAKTIIATCGDIRRTLDPISESSLLSRVSRLDRNKDAIQEAKRLLDVAERDFAHLEASYLIASVDHLKQDSTTLVVKMAEIQV